MCSKFELRTYIVDLRFWVYVHCFFSVYCILFPPLARTKSIDLSEPISLLFAALQSICSTETLNGLIGSNLVAVELLIVCNAHCTLSLSLQTQSVHFTFCFKILSAFFLILLGLFIHLDLFEFVIFRLAPLGLLPQSQIVCTGRQ